MYMAAESSYNAANYQRACDKLGEAEKLLGAGNAKIEYLRIKSLMELKKYDDAKASIAKYFEYAKNNKGSDKYSEVMMLYANMDEASAEGSYTEGKRLFEAKSYAGAVEKLNYVKQVSPDKYKDIYRMLANANDELGNYKEAVANYKVLASENAGDVSYQYILAEADIKAGYYSDAVKIINDAKQKVGQSNFPKAMLLLSSIAYYKTGNYQQAVEDASQFISNSKYADNKEAFVYAYVFKSAGYLGMKDYDKALSSCNYAIKCDKVNPQGYNMKAWIMYKQANYSEALVNAKKAVQLDAKNTPEVLHTLAAIQCETGDISEAMKNADKILSDKPTYGHAYEVKGNVLQTQGNMVEACKYWKQACDNLEPEDDERKACDNLKQYCK